MTPGTACRLALAGLLSAAAGRGMAAPAPVTLLDLFEPIRSAAVGGAGAALGNDTTLAPLNPAAAARAARPTVTLGGRRGLFDDLIGHVSLTIPAWRGGWFAGLSFYESAAANLRASDGTTRDVLLQQDIVVSNGYAWVVSDYVSCGVAARILRSELFGEFRSQAGAVDAGVQVRLTSSLKAAVVVRNLGPRFRYYEEALAPRTEARAGLAGGWLVRQGGGHSPGDTLIVAADGVWDTATRSFAGCVGAEYRWLGLLAVRAGARAGGPPGQPIRVSAGLGFTHGPCRVDYGLHFGSALSTPHAVALTITF